MRQIKVSFESDYNNGVHPDLLHRLVDTNDEKSSGYGFDAYCASAKEKIRKACGCANAGIYFLIGGTQVNSTVIDALTLGYEGVIAAATAHIAVHESGAVEAFGHKVITIASEGSKLTADGIEDYMQRLMADESHPHMVQPRVVYITFPTEYGALYSRQELAAIYTVCQRHDLLLYVDGARLGYGLMSHDADLTLPFLASHCDVFYIGGTKVGAMFGEAVVFTGTNAPRGFFTTVKRHGALLAKGRMLGLQFDTLFTDDLYFRIARHAIDMATRLVSIFASHGLQMAFPSPTNQQFVVLSPSQYAFLMEHIAFEIWERQDADHILCRFVTSWATTEDDLRQLDEELGAMKA